MNAYIPRPSLEIAENAWEPQQEWPHYERTRWTVSIHEAGHLVAMIVEGLYPDAPLVARVFESPTGVSGEVAISADPDPADHAIRTPPGAAAHPGFRPAALKWAAMLMAGFAAEILLHGLEGRIRGWPEPLADTQDFQEAAFFLGFGWPDQKGGATWVAWRTAMHTLSKHWAWVLLVGTEVHQTGKCTRARALELREIASRSAAKVA